MSDFGPLRTGRTYRLVTRSDFDGLVCAALLMEIGLLDDLLFAHPKDVQDGKVELTEHDITTNLPYRPEVALAFDHHASESLPGHRDAAQSGDGRRRRLRRARRVRALRRTRRASRA